MQLTERQQQIDAECTKLAEEADELARQVEELTDEPALGL
jgi:NTP pyrophosphatase (non-canonical NTP hydrolase)